nr:hypothetical protein [Tanacetum cinerariifolium]
MPALEDIIYSDDEEDVGAKADFSNLETSITVSPIPTTRVYKDHLVTQIIGDVSSSPQTKSMARMCQPDNQNVDFSGSDQIQTPQYPDVNPPSPEIKYDQSTSTDRPIFLNDNEDHPVQNKESPENSSEEAVVSKTNQEPPRDSDIHQLIEECSIKVPEQQKQKMEDTMLELVKICQAKKFLCIHDDVDDLIESALDSKLLLINSNSQRLDKKEQEVKNVIEQPAEHGKLGIRRVVPRNYNAKGERFLIASRFPTPPLACAFFSLRATETSSSKLARDQTSNPTSSTNPTPKGRIRKSSKQKVENSHFEENLTLVDTMTDNRNMAEMLHAPTEGCAEAIIVPPILAEQFELKHSL